MLGCLDMRSSGYFHVSRDTLQQIIKLSFNDNCSFFSETDFSNGSKTKDESLHDSSLNSRDDNSIQSQKERNGQKKMQDDNQEDPVDLDDTKGNGVMHKSRGHSYYPLLHYKKNLDKTFYYQYFRPYAHDYRILRMEEECQCPRDKIHDSKCLWYYPDMIYILDTKGDLSTSEQVAKQKIYQMYQNTLNNPLESCGCGSAAEIVYMGHNTGCIKFLHLHERESYEVLLAILKKRKKVTFHDDTVVEPKRAKLDPTVETAGGNDITDVLRAKEIQPNLSQAIIDALSVLADTAIATSDHTPPNNPPNSFPDLVTETVDGADCPCKEDDEEMPPLEMKLLDL